MVTSWKLHHRMPLSTNIFLPVFSSLSKSACSWRGWKMASQVRVPPHSSLSARECQKSIAITTDQVSTVFFCSGRCSGSRVTSVGWSKCALGQRHSAPGEERLEKAMWEDYIGKKPLGRERLEALPHLACIEHAWEKPTLYKHGRGEYCVNDLWVRSLLIQCFGRCSLSPLGCFAFLNKLLYFSF